MEKKLTQRMCVRLLVVLVGLMFGMEAQARNYVLRTCDQYSSDVLQAKASEYQPLIDSASAQYGVSVNLITAVIAAETCFRPRAVSHKGARGLMQLMPATARRFGVTNSSVAHNVHGGTRYLRWLLERYKGSVHHAVAAYNSGEGSVDFYGPNVPFSETQRYVRQVLNVYRKLGGRGGMDVFRAAILRSPVSDEAVEAAEVATRDDGLRQASSVVERRLKPRAVERRLLPSCMGVPRSVHRITTHRDKKGERTYYYKVRSGDSIDRISELTGSSKIMIKRYNDLDRSLIKVGQKLVVTECRLG